MKKETGNWNDSAVNRPEASGSAGASTAGVDSLRSPGSFSSNSSDADQVGAQHFLHLLFSSFLFFFFRGGAIEIANKKKVLEFCLPRRAKKLAGRVFWPPFLGSKCFGKKKVRERETLESQKLTFVWVFFIIIFPFFFIIIVCV